MAYSPITLASYNTFTMTNGLTYVFDDIASTTVNLVTESIENRGKVHVYQQDKIDVLKQVKIGSFVQIDLNINQIVVASNTAPA